MAVSATPVPTAPAAWRRRAQGVAVLGATLAAVVVWLVAAPLFGQDLVVQQPGREAIEVGFGAVVTFSLVPSLAGWALLFLLERLTARARVIWTVIASAVLVLSFGPVLGVEAAGTTKLTLALLHLAVGAVLIPIFWRTARTPER
ncbi:hypothetical protein SAMN04489712_101179 [Thermomonospora echinospora]|uniref:Uncharacterized protein n=1 Tax=Thermomonospora echinospora TaxID=1992 RepID=A0A1H5SER4_9ACTN|nr:DUF6069 family protein [Thermomonospora echinospora]SEF49069.1 hypothetical protein SAMN04489712_101179 [Thermomonospora echinospora]